MCEYKHGTDGRRTEGRTDGRTVKIGNAAYSGLFSITVCAYLWSVRLC